ncbi:serine/threonine protein kinase [Nonomuraea candida]|uniref:serine/threonine protein kinase n=1 Tax=Nonomuraea candida TaxID=359159 RepID=UPI001FE162B9|nr:serine/threonine protein kinase [Nonomuraea candida]
MSDSAVMVGGRYRLLRTIGKGGMGTVWQAHDEVLGRDVAVKEVLPPPDLTGPEREVFAVRTFREARAAGRVAHPGVATVYDVLEERGHPWIVMELVRSRTLGERVREDGPMSPLEAARIGLQLMEALRAAHAAGVLHRDVKPDNVLLTEDGRAVLTDFGIATTEDEAPVTRTGILVGTPAFMAPERAAGGRARPASDLWSLGVTLYLAVEGHSPFHRDNALATLGAVMHAEPEPLARAGVLGPVLLGLLRKDPAERMTLEEAERRLAAILTGRAPEETGPVVVPGQVRRQSSRWRPRLMPMAAIAGGALLVGLVTGGAAWWSSQRTHDARHLPAKMTTPTAISGTPSAPPSTLPSTTPAPRRGDPPANATPRTTPPVSPPASGPRVGGPAGDSPPAGRDRSASPSGEREPAKRSPSQEPEPGKTKKDKKDKKEDQPEETPGGAPGQVEGSDNAEPAGQD